MGMKDFIIKRSLFSLGTFFVILILNFILPRAMPGDPLSHFMGTAKLTPEMREAVIIRFGLDKSLWEQFVIYIQNTFHGDFGTSFAFYPQPVITVILNRLPWTLSLLLLSFFISTSLGMITGIFSAWRHGSKRDVGILSISMLFWSMPYYWMAMVLLLVFGLYLQWFPLGGAISAGVTHSGVLDFLLDYLKHAFLPLVALTIGGFASRTMVMRNTMIGVLGEDYILTAEAKGLSDRTVMIRHAARNAMLPMVTMIALNLGFIVGGAIFTETVFSYPGVGRLVYTAIMQRDYPLLQGAFFVLSVTVLTANFLADLAYAKLDPRVTY